jgi:hypothetical protein
MNLRPEVSPVDSVIHGDNMALLVAASAATSMATLMAAEPVFFEVGDQYIVIPPSANISRTTIVYNVAKAQLLIISQGMSNLGNVAAILATWSNTQSPQQSNNVWNLAAQYVIAQIPVGIVTAWQSITLIGHSFGGATCHWLAKLLRVQIVPTAYVFCYTYGSPKSEVRGGNYGYNQIAERCVKAVGDPVPGLPPGPGEMGNVWMLCGVPTARLWANWFHFITQLFLAQDGRMFPVSSDAFVPDPTFVFTLTSWISGTNAFGSPNHALSAYQGLVALMTPALVRSSLPTTVIDRSPAPDTSQSYLVRTRNVTVAAAAAANDAAPEAAVAGIVTNVPTVPGTRFHGRQHGRVHAVYYGTALITYVRTERVQRRMVRRLNLTVTPF